MDEYKKHLAERLFTEDKIVTYRTLSRALKVHVNTAKGMLYEFHRWQNAMTQGKVHATYLIYGVQTPEPEADGDVEMTSSAPEVNSQWDASQSVTTQRLTLVSEENVKDALALYSQVTSFQVYSLSAHPVKELQTIADVAREGRKSEEAADTENVFGTITNPNTRKRDRQGKRPVPASAPKPQEKKSATTTTTSAAPKPAEEKKVKQEADEKPAQAAKPSAASSKKAAAPPTLKKGGSAGAGGIMSAFAKAKPKATPSQVSTPKTEEQSPAMSDDGADDDEVEPIPAPKKPSASNSRPSRKDREEELKRMMEESDEEEEKEEEDAEMEEAPEPEPEPEQEEDAKTKEEEPAEVVSGTGDGRRRGKRKVMKKKQVMDDQGYLVTIQEQGWESFSEDEAPPPSKQLKTPASTSSGSQASSKPKKPAPKGQGSIMSFFAKK